MTDDERAIRALTDTWMAATMLGTALPEDRHERQHE
jgi:hypothetical protein